MAEETRKEMCGDYDPKTKLCGIDNSVCAYEGKSKIINKDGTSEKCILRELFNKAGIEEAVQDLF